MFIQSHSDVSKVINSHSHSQRGAEYALLIDSEENKFRLLKCEDSNNSINRKSRYVREGKNLGEQ